LNAQVPDEVYTMMPDNTVAAGEAVQKWDANHADYKEENPELAKEQIIYPEE
jgi:hypothetical protein